MWALAFHCHEAGLGPLGSRLSPRDHISDCPPRFAMGGGERACDAQSAAVFVIGLVAGTVCIIVSKALFELKAVGSTGKLEEFHPPVFESFVMFFGMLFALPMYLSG